MDIEFTPASSTPPEAFGFAPEPIRGGRNGSKTLPIVLAAIVGLLAGAAGGAFLGARRADNHWESLYDQALGQVAQLESESASWKQSSEEFEDQLQDLQKDVEASVGDLDNPRFVLWNSCGAGPLAGCSLTPGYEYVGGVPDTFTYYLSFRSTVPVTVRIMTTHDYVCWKSGYCAAHWVWWEDFTTLNNGVFHDAEGCGGYLAVFTSKQAGTLYPDVRITRNPSAVPTGACA